LDWMGRGREGEGLGRTDFGEEDVHDGHLGGGFCLGAEGRGC